MPNHRVSDESAAKIQRLQDHWSLGKLRLREFRYLFVESEARLSHTKLFIISKLGESVARFFRLRVGRAHKLLILNQLRVRAELAKVS